MKKLLIVNNNMKVGGVQKSLYNLLWSLDPTEYDVTLLLFSKTGAYLENLPATVRVIEETGPFRLFGKSQGEYAGFDALKRGLLAIISRLCSRQTAISLMRMTQPRLPDSYDCAISFLHNGRKKSFYGGVQDYVLHCVRAERKVAWLHCDYQNCGANHPENNRMMERFDAIAACSEGCRRSFLAAIPHLKDRCVTVSNCHRFDEILALADAAPIAYSPERVNVVTVARLSHEKGLDRAIRAVAAVKSAGTPVTLHVVGDGPMRSRLQMLAQELSVSDIVVFHGEQSNPYPYIKQADLFLLSSYHEAAPMVIEEARCLGVPVLSTQTTSTDEMVLQAGAGWACENSQSALSEALVRATKDREALHTIKKHLLETRMDNRKALAQFADAVCG